MAAFVKTKEARRCRVGRDRGVRGSIASTPWEQDAHVRDSKKNGRKTRSTSLVLHVDPPKRSSDVVKRPVPW
jgi:hypothetical protein